MKTCKECNGKNIKSRSNYSHGRGSRSITIFSCKDCGSTNIDVQQQDRRFNKRGRK